MIISQCRRVSVPDLTRYAWAGLRRFQNSPFVEEQICRLHALDKSQRPNAKKQSVQIRHCLVQAKEYFDAASSVTLATQPVLLYYSIMSLALAEILMKQSGESSLDRARAEHRHHGLELRTDSVPKDRDDLASTASALRAVPLVRPNGRRFGTFELWHRSCREMPLAGDITTAYSNGTTSTAFRPIFLARDNQLSSVPNDGINLLECLRSLPGMLGLVHQHGVESKIVRGVASVETQEGAAPVHSVSLIVHPGSRDAVTSFFENWKVDPNGVDRVAFDELPSGGVVRWTNDAVNGGVGMYIPPGSMWNDHEIRFWPSEEPLNEFGYLYVALFIAGNFARYFPDKWVLDVERSTPLALAVEELVTAANVRMPLLALSEMTRTYQIPEK